MNEPLAIKLRPKVLDDIIGQEHLVGKGMVLRNILENKKAFSMILYGKPGIGKTSVVNVIAATLGLKTRYLNAVVNNKKDIDIVIEEAKMYGGIILVMDEIHRLNKDKQDILLPRLESGLVTLIGMTTSNPYHSINPAIRSRCQIFELHELTTEDILKGLKRAVKSEFLEGITVKKGVLEHIAKLSGSDLRSAYNLIELAYYSASDKVITKEIVSSINSKPVFFSDKNEDGHYDVLSAFQKSIRGSDVNASLHYLARLIEEGDFDSIYRRMTVIAYEDIGLANPSIGPKVVAAIKSCELLGMPEARIPLSVVVTEMALSPKSNTAHVALDLALQDIRNGNVGTVPSHIKMSSNEYKYPHDYKDNIVKQQYLPDNIKNIKYYIPKPTSKYEIALMERYKYINEKMN